MDGNALSSPSFPLSEFSTYLVQSLDVMLGWLDPARSTLLDTAQIHPPSDAPRFACWGHPWTLALLWVVNTVCPSNPGRESVFT